MYSLVHWTINSLTHCFIDSLISIHSFIGYWFTDSSIHWSIGSLHHWFIGSWVHSDSCAWILSCHLIGISTAICSFVDAPHSFIAIFFLWEVSTFRNFRPGTGRAPPSCNIWGDQVVRMQGTAWRNKFTPVYKHIQTWKVINSANKCIKLYKSTLYRHPIGLPPLVFHLTMFCWAVTWSCVVSWQAPSAPGTWNRLNEKRFKFCSALLVGWFQTSLLETWTPTKQLKNKKEFWICGETRFVWERPCFLACSMIHGGHIATARLYIRYDEFMCVSTTKLEKKSTCAYKKGFDGHK